MNASVSLLAPVSNNQSSIISLILQQQMAFHCKLEKRVALFSSLHAAFFFSKIRTYFQERKRKKERKRKRKEIEENLVDQWEALLWNCSETAAQ